MAAVQIHAWVSLTGHASTTANIQVTKQLVQKGMLANARAPLILCGALRVALFNPLQLPAT